MTPASPPVEREVHGVPTGREGPGVNMTIGGTDDREVHAVPAPPLSVEDGIALLSKSALEVRDPALVNIAAQIATAYGTGDQQQMMNAYLALSDYMRSLYAAGKRPSTDLQRAAGVLTASVGGYDAVNTARQQRDAPRPQPPAPVSPELRAAAEQRMANHPGWNDPGYEAKMQQLLGDEGYRSYRADRQKKFGKRLAVR